ncbi:hypothetical protein [Clostridium butyricum]|uniref:Phage XkdN-like protein n=1 Tax=Clostridium butyricum E4 str. BoNT E BL5262 TaxID=632245 RepID=C4II26_CLOBU|nr:hypothetical protein [Clostridium butyricum]EDT75825.1 hypothetical protein CBY_2826 [Clostridium butyricum 5521]EEP54296.1 conserved hypothetical protein [Clostridium butyricum E4 str. BoNT E BL5262]NFL33224.1 hypothetical protein [Clostridium butyricum]NFS20414.1 hypothetical protein [Clostridium butyricum]
MDDKTIHMLQVATQHFMDERMMKMDNKKMTLEAFKAKAIDKYRNRILVADIEVDGFGTAPFNRPSDNAMLEYLNGAAKGAKISKDEYGNMNVDETDMIPVAEAAKILVYNCCSYLHDTELQKEVEVKDPYDMPFTVFGVDATLSTAEKISDIFGAGKVKEDVKN